MTRCCGNPGPRNRPCGATPAKGDSRLGWFADMLGHCVEYAGAQRDAGRPVVGIMCEYAPRELIMAAGGVPVCLCGGSAATIPAAERELPAGLCPLIKSTYGYYAQKSNPFLEMADLLVAETTCDGKKKMFELMSAGRQTYVLELPQKEGDPDALEHWKRELEKFKRFLESRYAVGITGDKLRDAVRLMNRERRARRELAALMQSDQPPLTGRELLEFKSTISCIPESLDAYDAALATFRGNGAVADAASRVRVLVTGVPIVHGAERVMDIIEGSGGLVVCMENCTGLKPILEDVDESAPDLMDALAEKYFRLPCSVKTPNHARTDSLRSLAVEYRPECVIDLIWQGCLTYDIETHWVRRLAEEELKLPFLRIETDYSPSDSARIAMRVEALFETIRSRRAERHGRE